MKNVSIVELEGERNYAILAPGQITYALNASKKELVRTVEEVYQATKNIKVTPPSLDECSLALIPTFNCNLRCIYCYANAGKTKEKLSLEHAKIALNYIRKKHISAKVLNLYLVGGGEPLLYLDLVKKITEYADSIFKKVEIHVVSNGTFPKTTLDWLFERQAHIRISYDVLGQTSQRPFANGKKSVTVVRENIKKLVERGLDPLIQCIVTAKTVNHLKEMVDILVKLGVSAVKFEPCLMTDVSRGTKELQPDPVIFANALLNVIEYIALNEKPILIDTGYFSKPTLGKYCGMGNGNFTITPEGMITPCVEIARKTDPYADKLMIGSLQGEVKINNKNIGFLQKLNYQKQRGGCAKCNLRLMCLGGCPMANIWQKGLPLTKSDFTCIVEHTFLPKLLTKIIQNDKIMHVVIEDPEKTYG